METAKPTQRSGLRKFCQMAFALGIGTTIGYKRIVVTIAEKIGKSHLTYAQGAAAETVAALTIFMADKFHLPVSTTHVLSSGVAGTMWSNNSGVQPQTVRKILLAWAFTLPCAMTIAATLFFSFGGRVPYNRVLNAVLEFLRQTCEPYLRLFRRFIPPLGPIDLSPMVAIIGLYLIGGIVAGLIRG